jgi:deoxycytidine triphosphate deaminase
MAVAEPPTPGPGRTGSGRLLGREAILARVERGEIFALETFSEADLRGAAYDLRIAKDLLVTPDGHRYGPGVECDEPITLKPGETAFVTTLERLRFPWDIAANIAPKYEKARHGLVVFSGLLVDPGYGLEFSWDAGWKPKLDERLHFLVTNLSSIDRPLQPGTQKIAALQFFEVEPVPRNQRYPISGVNKVWEDLTAKEASPIGGLAFFNNVVDRAEIKEVKETIEGVKGSIGQLKNEFTTLNNTTDKVVVFGLYVLAAALLGMSIAALVALFGDAHQAVTISFANFNHMKTSGWVFFALTIAAGAALGAMLAKGLSSVARAVCGR